MWPHSSAAKHAVLLGTSVWILSFVTHQSRVIIQGNAELKAMQWSVLNILIKWSPITGFLCHFSWDRKASGYLRATVLHGAHHNIPSRLWLCSPLQIGRATCQD